MMERSPGPSTVAMSDSDVIAITTTFSTREAADACGRSLVETGLAACVQIDGPLTSVFRWQGVVETAVEWRCTCKTTPAREAECVAAVGRLHDYATPQITVARLTAATGYAAWVNRCVAGE